MRNGRALLPVTLVTAVSLVSIARAAERAPAFPDDKVLRKLEASLPRGWKFIREPGRLIVEGDQPLWEVPFNRINAPPDWERDAEREWKEAKKTKSAIEGRFIFSVEPRWPPARRTDAEAKNRAIADEGRHENAPANGHEPSKADWADAMDADAKLQARLIKLPYDTERYSLFLIEKHGIEDEYTVIFPREAGQDAWAAWDLVSTAFEGAKGK